MGQWPARSPPYAAAPHLALDALVVALDIPHDHDVDPHYARGDYSFEGRQG